MRTLAVMLLNMVCSALVIAPLPAEALFIQNYVEDFTSTTYRDPAQTTLWWDTTSGQIKLAEFTPSLAGGYNTPGNARDVVVTRGYAFVADFGSGLLVLDVSIPSAPIYVNNLTLPGYAMDLALHGRYLFVACSTGGIQVVDVNNPTSPGIVGSFGTASNAYGVAVAGDRLYVACFNYGLQVLDIIPPTSPSLVGSLSTFYGCHAIAVAGDYVYLVGRWSADADDGLQVIDISNPASPSLVATSTTTGTATHVCVQGNYVYVADRTGGLKVFDTTNPAAPSPVGGVATTAETWGVTVTGDRAYVGDGAAGLMIMDVQDPTSPVLLHTIDTPGVAATLSLSGEYAFVADQTSGMQVAHVRTAGAAVPSHLESSDLITLDDVAVDGDYAYVAKYRAADLTVTTYLMVVNIDDPWSPTLVQNLYLGDTPAWGVDVDSDHAFLVGSELLWAVDVSNPASPVLINSWLLPGPGRDVEVVGNQVYVACTEAGFESYDVTDPSTPGSLGYYDTAGAAWAVTISGDFAYVADGMAGLLILDVTYPTNPLPVGSLDFGDNAYHVAVSGDLACVAGSDFWVVDVHDPGTPVVLGSLPDSGFDLRIEGDLVYVVGGYNIKTIDISDPTSPTLVRTYALSNPAQGLDASGDHLFVTEGLIELINSVSGGFEVFQIHSHAFFTGENVAQSLIIDSDDMEIYSARITTTQNDLVNWSLSANSGTIWQDFSPDSAWQRFLTPGENLLWRSEHLVTGPDPFLANPLCSDLQIEWRYLTAVIDSIVDVPGDQGSWVRIHYASSGRDWTAEPYHPATAYDIYRRVDDPILKARITKASSYSDHHNDVFCEVIKLGGRSFLIGSTAKNTGFPPGVWEAVATQHALQEDRYVVLAPTLADSSDAYAMTTYLVTTHTTTPTEWYVSPPDSGYSVDNIAPGLPTNIVADYQTTFVSLDWDDAPENDFQFYRVYRDTDPTFVPTTGNLLTEIAISAYTDVTPSPWSFYYKISAVDHAGNEGPAGAPETVTNAQVQVVPTYFSLHDAVPNPFNPRTTLSFSLPTESHVRLVIYDLSGGIVTTLLSENCSPGRHDVVWEGRDDQQRDVASGVYIYRLEAGSFAETKRMVLLR